MNMSHRLAALAAATLIVVTPVYAQQPQQQDARELASERASAEYDAPHLVDVLGLKPGMTVADVGSGGGSMTVVLGKWIGPGRVYATDITEHALRWTRQLVEKEGLKNVTVLEGGADRTNLPAACCDALFLRHVYHHIGEIPAFNKSLLASLKPGGRLAIIDFVPSKGSPLPKGVPANREGHGIPIAVVIEELKAAGFTYERTIDRWPPGEKEVEAAYLVLFKKP